MLVNFALPSDTALLSAGYVEADVATGGAVIG
jgi:hypothetical protein